MNVEWNTNYIKSDNLVNISRGDAERMKKYLYQFQELIPTRINNLRNSLEEKNRKMIRQIIHQMSPQLQFFGVPNVLVPIRRLEHEFETMPFMALEAMVADLVLKLEAAERELGQVLQEHF